MIEFNVLPPAVRDVTFITGRLLGIRMHIIDFVAGQAIFRRVFITFIDMTLHTRDVFVLACQRKLGLTVIVNRVLPHRFLMAIRAFCTKPTLMMIIFFMTTIAIGRSLPEFLLRKMTIFARHGRCGMRPHQLKAG